MGLRVRKKKNQSGSISVQIVDRTNRGYKVVETLGCSDDEIEIDKLHQKAILRINDLSQNLFSKSLDETSEKLLLKKLLSKLSHLENFYFKTVRIPPADCPNKSARAISHKNF